MKGGGKLNLFSMGKNKMRGGAFVGWWSAFCICMMAMCSFVAGFYTAVHFRCKDE